MSIEHRTVLHAPALREWSSAGAVFYIDAEAPNWIVTDERGAWCLQRIDGRRTMGDIVAAYAATFRVEAGKAWLHVHDFLAEAERRRMVSPVPMERPPYAGRSAHLRPDRLREFWMHTNNSCNLTCTHCLVNSSPRGERGLPLDDLRRMVDEAVALGVERFYFTGGEPFVRRDLPELIRYITETKAAELAILTNATLFQGSLLHALDAMRRERLRFQVSLDGSTPQINDPIRGAGTFQATTEGLRSINHLGFKTTLTTVVTAANLHDLADLTRIATETGTPAQHLMWLHKRGRILDDGAVFPTVAQLLDAVRKVKRTADALGVTLDNYEALTARVNGPPGLKYDLGNAGWQSLCLYADGHIYPSAAFANHPPLDCGQAGNGVSLRQIWLDSPVAQQIRHASVARKRGAADDPFRFITGGGDIEHSYFFGGDFLAEDPYYELYVGMIRDIMVELADQQRALVNRRSGYDAPRVFHAMGEGAVYCGAGDLAIDPSTTVSTLHSNCVLSFDIDKPRQVVRKFYTNAAVTPQAELCCPTTYDAGDVAHIPQEVLDRFYGCGSPMSMAGAQIGETVVDLGSGAGIDCFIAAKQVGPTGRVIGVDMTDAMLQIARASQRLVAQRLGYDVVEFRQGFLEQIPVEAKSVDLITSNCVINLSPDKLAVFREMWRILKDHGRVVIADIVSDRMVPPWLQTNEQLWGECIVGALSQEAFVAKLEQAGFYGLALLKHTFWKTIEGYHFYAVTVQGRKFEKTAGCHFIGQRAIYRGPMKAVVDEEGHLFPRNAAVEICTDTAAKLKAPPYAGSFTIVEPHQAAPELVAVLAPSAPGCCPTDGSGGGCC